MDIPHGAHVAVLDGRKFLLLHNRGEADLPVLDVVDSDEQVNPSTAEQGTDEPGSTFTGTAGHGAGSPDHRSGYEQTDFHQQAEDDFAADHARALSRLVEQGKVSQLVVVAAPKALGRWRAACDKRLANVVIGEVAKEATNQPTDAIAAMVQKA